MNPFRFRFDLVASFHARFVPPSPFFRDPGGLPLPGLCDLFQPLTPLGFGFPCSPAARPLCSGLATFVFRVAASRSSARRPILVWRGGWVSLLQAPGWFLLLVAFATRCPVPPLRSSRRPFRLRLPSASAVPRCSPGHRGDLSCGVQSFPGFSFPIHPFQPPFPSRSEDRFIRGPPGQLPLRACLCSPVWSSAAVLATPPTIPTGHGPLRARCAPDLPPLDGFVVRVFWLGFRLPRGRSPWSA
jgi:hypothetical protein